MPGKRSGKPRPSRDAPAEPKVEGFLDKLRDSWALLPRPALRAVITKLRSIVESLEQVAAERAAEDRRQREVLIAVKKEQHSDGEEGSDEGSNEGEAKRRR